MAGSSNIKAFTDAFPSTGRAVVLYQDPLAKASAARRKPSLKSYLITGVACLVTAAVIGVAALEIFSGTAILTPIQALMASQLHHLFHLGLFETAREDFPELFRALGLAMVAGTLGMSIRHVAHQWAHEVRAAIGIGGVRALLAKLGGEFGRHCGHALAEFITFVKMALHRAEHGTPHAA